jgi:hypothetical protein
MYWHGSGSFASVYLKEREWAEGGEGGWISEDEVC